MRKNYLFSAVMIGFVFLCQPIFSDQTNSAQASSPCSSFSADEQQFASLLSFDNQTKFCTQFSPPQRAAAMQLTSTPLANGTVLSADQAVQNIASQNTNTQQKAPTRTPGGCPVK